MLENRLVSMRNDIKEILTILEKQRKNNKIDPKDKKKIDELLKKYK